ncbi:amino acid deaminase [Microbacterium murale]|uniref:amino acid deaminase n=1 Tax=Microbacterium murale TaxID=1081040 RepID=UPI0027D7D142|nr:amino acid deaminase [Microbacterium murale]
MTELAVHFLDAASARAARDTPADAAAAVGVLEWLTTSIEQDRAAGRFEAWGRSTLIDENVGKPVLARAVFEHLHELAGVEASWPIGNAGLVHCYGYLLSRMKTPYGLKRERWLGADLARAYGQPDDGFVPWSSGQTLLARATEAASALLSAPALSRTLLVDGRETQVAFSAGAGRGALAYVVAPEAGAGPLLITTFPITDVAAIIEDFDSEPRLRWNAA